MRLIDRLAWVRDRVQRQRDWLAAHGGDLAGYIRHYGDPGVAPLDKNGNSETITCPADVAEACGLRPVGPEAPGCYYKEHFGSGGTLIYQADKDCLDRYERELAELEPRYGRYLDQEKAAAAGIKEVIAAVEEANKQTRRCIRIGNELDLTPEQLRACRDADASLYRLAIALGGRGH